MSRKKIEMTPEDRLIEAIFGKETGEELKPVWDGPIEEHTNKTMNFVGWCNQVAKWQFEAKKIGARKYDFRDLVNLAEHFYMLGREDEKAGIGTRRRLWPDENNA